MLNYCIFGKFPPLYTIIERGQTWRSQHGGYKITDVGRKVALKRWMQRWMLGGRKVAFAVSN
jgi:hypothetical protein